MVDRTSSEYDGYARLSIEVKRRWREPSGHPTFGLFFVGSFLMFGAAGIWLEFFKLIFEIGPEPGSLSALRTAIATYFPAVLGSAGLQLAISEALRSLRALGYLIGALFGVFAFALVFAVNLADWAAILLGLIACVAALACWRVVYADDESLRDEPMPDPEVATGNVDPVAPLMGDDALSGFQS
jgi:hypothetical protein